MMSDKKIEGIKGPAHAIDNVKFQKSAVDKYKWSLSCWKYKLTMHYHILWYNQLQHFHFQIILNTGENLEVTDRGKKGHEHVMTIGQVSKICHWLSMNDILVAENTNWMCRTISSGITN